MDVVEYTLLLFLVILCTTAVMVEVRESLNSIWSAAAAQSSAASGAGSFGNHVH